MNGEGNGRCIMLALAELILFAVAAVAIGIVARKGSYVHKEKQKDTMRCPNCGSPVVDHGNFWQCTYCGNSGRK